MSYCNVDPMNILVSDQSVAETSHAGSCGPAVVASDLVAAKYIVDEQQREMARHPLQVAHQE